MNYGIDRLGLVKTSLIDFPGRVSAVIFTAGCNYRCPFCHNPELTYGTYPDTFLPREEVLETVARRRHVLDGVVITGGEPTLHPELTELTDGLRELGLEIKLDTNGSHPEAVAALRPEYVAVDIKCEPRRYPRLTDIDTPVERLKRTLRYLRESGTEHELRTTVVPGLVDFDGFGEILELVRGSNRYVLNEFRPEHALDQRFRNVVGYPPEVYERLCDRATAAGIPCTIRGPSFSPLAEASEGLPGS